MSDWEENMYDDDEEEEELSFDDEDNGDDMDSQMIDDKDGQLPGSANEQDIESMYFQGKAYKEDDNITAAIETFEKITTNMESPSSAKYVFKSLKQLIKIYEQQQNSEKVLDLLDSLFFMRSNDSIDVHYFISSMTKIITRMERSNNNTAYSRMIFTRLAESITNIMLLDVNIMRLKIKTDLCLASCLLNDNDISRASNILNETMQLLEDSKNSNLKTTYYLEVIALRIVLILTSDYKQKLRELKQNTDLANSLISGIPQTRILGIINEGSGIVAMYSHDFKTANYCFQNAFKNFNDFGDNRRKGVVIKFILSSILSKSEVNPFQSNDFQGFDKDPDISIMMKMYNAYQRLDLDAYTEIINEDDMERIRKKDTLVCDFLPYTTDQVRVCYLCETIPMHDKIEFVKLASGLHVDIDTLKRLLRKTFFMGYIKEYKINFIKSYLIKIETIPFIDTNTSKFIDNTLKLCAKPDSTSFESFEAQLDHLQNNIDNGGSAGTEIDHLSGGMDLYNSTNTNGGMRYLDPVNEGRSHSRINTMGLSYTSIVSDNEDFVSEIQEQRFDAIFPKGSLRRFIEKLKELDFIDMDSANEIDSRNILLRMISKYIQILEQSVPVFITPEIPYVWKVQKSRTMQDTIGRIGTESIVTNSVGNAPNIPDVIQNATMNQMDPPANPDDENDDDLHLSERMKKLELLKFNHRIISAIVKKYQEQDLKNINFSDSPTINDTSKLRGIKRSLDPSRSFTGNNMNVDQSETVSLDYTSIDDEFREYDDFR